MASSIRGKRKSAQRAMLSRAGSVTGWGGYLFVYGDRRAGESSRQTLSSLDINGEFLTPVRGITTFVIRVNAEQEPSLGNAEIPSVGIWSKSKPNFDGGVYLSEREFDLILAMAAAGKLASVHFHFQEPHYGKSLIASVSFSSEPASDE